LLNRAKTSREGDPVRKKVSKLTPIERENVDQSQQMFVKYYSPRSKIQTGSRGSSYEGAERVGGGGSE